MHGSVEAREVLSEFPAVDLHADPLLWAHRLGYDLNRAHRPPLPWAWLGGHWDVPRARAGGLGAQFFGLVSLPRLDRDLFATCVRQIELLEAAALRSDGALALVRSVEEQAAVEARGAVAAWLGLEGAHALDGRIERLDELARRGVRYLGLLHFTRNACGAPSVGSAGRSGEGLSAFGREVVARAEALGVVIDLAHINRAGFFDVCRQATRPPIVSHTGCSGIHAMWRNIDDEQLRAVADRGGIVGVIFVPHYLGGGGIDRVVDHLLHVVRVGGEDAAALGSDWDGFVRPTRGLEEASKLPVLVDALRARGLSRATLGKLLRGNALRVFGRV